MIHRVVSEFILCSIAETPFFVIIDRTKKSIPVILKLFGILLHTFITLPVHIPHAVCTPYEVHLIACEVQLISRFSGLNKSYLSSGSRLNSPVLACVSPAMQCARTSPRTSIRKWSDHHHHHPKREEDQPLHIRSKTSHQPRRSFKCIR